MVKSMQRAEMGEKRFFQLQEKTEKRLKTALKKYQDAVDPDTMGPDGKEGIGDED